MRVSCLKVCVAALLLAGAARAQRPDGLYAEIRTSRGLIVARLEMDLAPMTVANFVGLAEGSIANAAFDAGQPFYDGTVWHRVVPGHVIQAGVPHSDRGQSPGYQFPNEIHAKLSHDHLGALNMANSGPNTNAAEFCIMLGDRSYLDGDYTVFGDTVEGLDVVQKILQGDVVETIRIVRMGTKAEAFRPTTETFRAMVKAAEQSVAEQVEKKKAAEREWIAANYPKATGPEDGVLTERVALGDGSAVGAVVAPPPASDEVHVRYRGKEVRYMGQVTGWQGPAMQVVEFASGENGVPGFESEPKEFVFTKINPGLDGVIAGMAAGEKRIAIVPAALGYKTAGAYPPEVPGKKRFVVSPNALLVYEVEVVGQ